MRTGNFRFLILIPAVAFFCGSPAVSAQELIRNGSFNQRDTFWTVMCSAIEAWGTECTYGGSNCTNRVAEIDDMNCFYQDVCILPDQEYIFTMKATRRPGNMTPNPCITTLKIVGLNASNNVVTTYVNMNISRNNTTLSLSAVTGIPAVHVLPSSGVVRLRVSLQDNSPGYATYGMIVDDLSLVPKDRLPGDTFAITGNDSICVSAPAVFSVAGMPASGVYYDWDFGAGATPATSALPAPSVSWSTPGRKEVVCILGNGVCVLDTLRHTVEVLPVPEVRILLDTLDCATLRFRADAPVIAGTQYDWWFGDGSTGSGHSVTHTYTTAGPFTIALRVTAPGGCTSYDTVTTALDRDLPLDLGPDTAICLNDTLILSVPQPPGMRCLWSTGTGGSRLRVISGGVYWVEAERNGCKRSDTIQISVLPVPGVWLGNDTTICEAFPLRIGSAFPAAGYLWSTGSEAPYISVRTTGRYWLRVNTGNCAAYDTINVTAMPVPDIDLGGDRDICDEQTIVLDGSWGNSRYRWNTGDTTARLSVTSAGFYRVVVTDEYHCVATDSVTLRYHPLPEVLLGADTVVCEETPLVLQPLHINSDSLIWSDGSTGWMLPVTLGAEYIVWAVNKCGMKSDTITVSQIFCDIWVPNAFTPNGDGRNDILRVVGNTGKLEGFRFGIFNRWGEQVFYTNERHRGWDGYYKGMPAETGTYVYMLEYSIAGTPYLLKGNVHLLR